MKYRTDMGSGPSGRHPFQLFTLYLACLVSIPAVLGVAPRPGTINEALPTWLAFGWSLVTAIGSATALIGVYLPQQHRVTGLVLEQLGLGLVALASLLYCAVALAEVGETAAFPVAFVGAFGLSCLWRYAQLQSDLNHVRHEQESGGA